MSNSNPNGLTRDNPQLTRLTNGDLAQLASNCTAEPLAEKVLVYVRESLSENTRKAYGADLAHFETWGGGLPACAENGAAYLGAHADPHKVGSLRRPLAPL